MTLTRLKLAWAAMLAIVFIAFSTWYGGTGKPISEAEGAALVQQVRQVYGDADARGFIRNIEAMIPVDDGREFYAVNLETLKQGPKAEQSDRAYARIVMPLLFKRASHPVFVSRRAGLMLGQYGDEIDRVAVVRYRSLRDLIEMTLDPAMTEGESYKFDALDHTEVFITRPMITFVHVRLTLALALILIGWLGLRGLDWLHARRQAA